MSKSTKVLLILSVIMSVCTCAIQGRADPDPSQAQDWTVDGFKYFGQGLLTPILLETYVANGHSGTDDGMVASDELWRTSLRIFYGLTNNINLFLQYNAAHPNGQSYESEGFEGGFHFKLYDRHGLKLGFAWENEWQRAPKYVDTAYDMDFHPLIEQDLGKFSFLVNPIFEKNLVGSGQWEGGYAAQALYNLSKDYAGGLEFYGNVGPFNHMPTIREQAHYIMPVVNIKYFSFGPGVGLTSGSDRLLFKLNVDYPIQIGTPWGKLE